MEHVNKPKLLLSGMKRNSIERALRLIKLFESGRHLTRTMVGNELGITPQAAGRWIDEITFVLPIAEYTEGGKPGRPENYFYLETDCTL